VSIGEGGTYTAVRDGTVTVEGGADVDAGFSIRMGAEAVANSAKPEALTEAGKTDAEELGRLGMLDIPESGLNQFARIIVETSPADAALFRDGQPCGRGSAALLAPFGKPLKLSASKAGYKTQEIDIAVSSEEAEKRYLIQLEPDPEAPITPSPTAGLQHILKLEAQIGILENEIKSREILYRAVATQSSSLGSERDLLLMDAENSRKETDTARSEAAAARDQINNLETQIKGLKTALDQEKERVRQIMELLKE
jgi:outer membrane murein-binding lipoprotein Lpp